MNFINQSSENFKKEKFIHHFKTIFWGVDLADIQLKSKYNKRIKYLLCAIDLFGKYAWVVPLNDKWGLVLLMHFKK